MTWKDELDLLSDEAALIEQGSSGDRENIGKAHHMLWKLYRHVLTPIGQQRADAIAKRVRPYCQAWYNECISTGRSTHEHFTFWYPDWLKEEFKVEYEKYVQSEASLARERSRSLDYHLAMGGSEPDE